MATAFTPLQSMFGGVLIGLAAIILMASLGRIMGATGILAGALRPNDGALWRERLVMIIGMAAAPILLQMMTGNAPDISIPASIPMVVIGGVLVGLGVTFGGGCTSGHGVCGLARFSGRSLVATLTFMAATFLTVLLIRHGWPLISGGQ